jgi:hypothetical protein
MNRLSKYVLKVLLKRYNKEYNSQSKVLMTNMGGVLTAPQKDGGVESWLPNYKFPFPGMPDDRVIETLTIFKRIFPIIYKYGWVVLRDRLPNHLRSQSEDGNIGLVDPKNFSRPVREIHRLFTLMRSREGEKEMRGKWTEMRDVVCLFLEYDDSYRFRFMDMMNNVNLKEFEFTEADKYWAEQKWKYKWSWQVKKGGEKK